MNEMMDPLLPSRWHKSPPIPTSTSALFANQAPPVNVQVSIAPTFTNANRQDGTVVLLAGLMIGFAVVFFLGAGNDRTPPRQ